MTSEEFNALPLEARRYIENKTTCLKCGHAQNLETHYQNYLKMKDASLYTLRRGAVAFKEGKEGKNKILYPLHPKDTTEQRKEKLETALKLNEVNENSFLLINVSGIQAELKSMEKDSNKTVLSDEEKAAKAAEKAAAAAAKNAEKEAAKAAKAEAAAAANKKESTVPHYVKGDTVELNLMNEEDIAKFAEANEITYSSTEREDILNEIEKFLEENSEFKVQR